MADFRKKYGYTPSNYGAQSYDAILLIDSALRATKGEVKDVRALVKEMRKANFASVRGKFAFNVNHHPIEDFYLLKAVKGARDIEMRIEKKVFDDHKDAYYPKCKMSW